MNYKIIFPTGYINAETNILNNNIDINIIFDTGDIYFGVLITAINIQNIMKRSNESYFFIDDLFIIRDLRKETIENSINTVIEQDIFTEIFTKIGILGESFYNGVSFESLPNMNYRAEDLYACF